MAFDYVEWVESELSSNRAFSQQIITAIVILIIALHYLNVDIGRLFGRARITYHHASKDVRLKLKDGSSKALSAICRESTHDCYLNPLLFNGHLQTVWGAVHHDGPTLDYKRKVFEAKDFKYSGSFAVDFVTLSKSEEDTTLPKCTTYFSEEELQSLGSDDSKPMLVALHGLSGGSYEAYVRQVLAPLTAKHGWEACVVNSRGCAMSEVTSSVLYNARATWDIRQTVHWLREKFPNRPLFGIGFSIGANILTNYVGEEGPNCELKAAVVCSNPWNLDACAAALQRSQVGLEVYSRAMCQNMKSLVEKHEAELTKEIDIDLEEFEKAKYLHEFDRVVQCPTWGYPTEDAYYRDASCTDSLFAVSIPLIAFHAEDDPICTDEAVPRLGFTKNPNAVLISTTSGGHLGWYQMGDQQWFATAAANFLDKMAQEVRLDDIRADAALNETDDSFDPMRRRSSVE